MLYDIENLIRSTAMAAPTFRNHRRERHEIRRILAEIVTRVRDPNEANSFWDAGFFDHQRRLAANDNRKDIVAVVASREHQ
jgi:hypothetical protein